MTSSMYGSGSIAGYEATDQVCLIEGEDSSCVSDVYLLTVDSVTGSIQELAADGVLGMGTKKADPNGEIFIGYLYD